MPFSIKAIASSDREREREREKNDALGWIWKEVIVSWPNQGTVMAFAW
jgi:hypothetical protein